jgi:hypothetical protein
MDVFGQQALQSNALSSRDEQFITDVADWAASVLPQEPDPFCRGVIAGIVRCVVDTLENT